MKSLKLGVKVGTTSYTAATGVTGSLPTAFAVAGELADGVIVGQWPKVPDDVEQFGIVLDRNSQLTRCVSLVVDRLRMDGTLAMLLQEWLAGAGRAPVLS